MPQPEVEPMLAKAVASRAAERRKKSVPVAPWEFSPVAESEERGLPQRLLMPGEQEEEQPAAVQSAAEESGWPAEPEREPELKPKPVSKRQVSRLPSEA